MSPSYSKAVRSRFLIATLRAVLVAVAAFAIPTTVCGQLGMAVPTTLTGHPGDTISIPLNLTVIGNQLNAANGNGIGAFSFVIGYDPTLSGGVGTIGLGSLVSTPSFGFSNFTTNNTTGLIRAVTSSTQGTTALPAGTVGTLAVIPFTISPTAAQGNYYFDLLAMSGGTTTSIVDNNFSTYAFGTGLTLTGGSLNVTPVPEPVELLTVAMATMAVARRWWLRVHPCAG